MACCACAGDLDAASVWHHQGRLTWGGPKLSAGGATQRMRLARLQHDAACGGRARPGRRWCACSCGCAQHTNSSLDRCHWPHPSIVAQSMHGALIIVPPCVPPCCWLLGLPACLPAHGIACSWLCLLCPCRRWWRWHRRWDLPSYRHWTSMWRQQRRQQQWQQGASGGS
jgi:hypothetical protein